MAKAKTREFDENAQEYDDWFTNNESYYQAELEAVRSLVPNTGKGIEIGIGTGRFAERLGIKVGLEPSRAMCTIAQKRGINTIAGVAEALPVQPESFEYVLLVTTICFLDSVEQAFSEVFRILRNGGFVVIGFLDKESSLARKYQSRKEQSRFYRDAHFHTVDEVARVLELTGFVDSRFVQTLFPGEGNKESIQSVKEGYGDGAFVVVQARKSDNNSQNFRAGDSSARLCPAMPARKRCGAF